MNGFSNLKKDTVAARSGEVKDAELKKRQQHHKKKDEWKKGLIFSRKARFYDQRWEAPLDEER